MKLFGYLNNMNVTVLTMWLWGGVTSTRGNGCINLISASNVNSTIAKQKGAKINISLTKEYSEVEHMQFYSANQYP